MNMNDNMYYFYIDKQNKSTASNISSLSEKKNYRHNIKDWGSIGYIKKVEDKSDKKLTYIANWNMKEMSYSWSGKIRIR
ncbi:MAG: hypothetical protein V8R17_03285 [Blautia obeum]